MLVECPPLRVVREASEKSNQSPSTSTRTVRAGGEYDYMDSGACKGALQKVGQSSTPVGVATNQSRDLGSCSGACTVLVLVLYHTAAGTTR